MEEYIDPIGRLVNQFSRLPGVGKKTALRYAYRIIDMKEEEVDAFAASLTDAKRKVKFCKICGNFTENDVCDICKTRNKSIICVVKEPKDVVALEKLHEYRGVYHVLHGLIDPINHIGPNDIGIQSLIARVDGTTKEVIMATDATVEGDLTATYIAKYLKPLDVSVTRIARGVPVGSEIEYTDDDTLLRALSERKPM